MTDHLIAPHGGELIDLIVSDDRATELRASSRDWPSWDLTPRQLCDLELLMSGAFSPLTGFMGKADYDRCVSKMRLADGTLWPIPITLDVTEDAAADISQGARIALRDAEDLRDEAFERRVCLAIDGRRGDANAEQAFTPAEDFVAAGPRRQSNSDAGF